MPGSPFTGNSPNLKSALIARHGPDLHSGDQPGRPARLPPCLDVQAISATAARKGECVGSDENG
jgi:hypothetical protein